MAHSNTYDRILSEKLTYRLKLESLITQKRTGHHIGKLQFQRNDKNTPLIFMSGRLDHGQKGFDVIFHAMNEMPAGSIKLLFSPSTSELNDTNYLDFYEEIAHNKKGDIEIWPYRLDAKLYELCLCGASFLLMPSFYEPFGAATEGFAHGTPVIARATGGLISQVIPYNSFYVPPSYMRLLDHFHDHNERCTGFLYREESQNINQGYDWQSILSQSPHKRRNIPLYSTMVDAARKVMIDASTVFKNKSLYGSMIIRGLNSLNRFSWLETARKYSTIYAYASMNKM